MKYVLFLLLFIIAKAEAQPVARALAWSPYMANPETESFSAIYSAYNNSNNVYNLRRDQHPDTLALVHIDSLGEISFCTMLDPHVIGFNSVSILSDSLLLMSWDSGYYGKTAISKYNVPSHKSNKILSRALITSISNDRNYFSCQRDNIAAPSEIYKIKNGDFDSTEKIATPFHICGSFGRIGFLAMDTTLARTGRSAPDRKFDYVIMRFDGSIADTLPKEFGHGYLEHGKNDRELINIPPRMTVYRGEPNPVISYNLDTKKEDTIFSDRIFFKVFAIPSTDYYLLNGLFEQEWKDQLNVQVEVFKREHPNGGAIDDLNTPTGYWMIGNSKTKKIKKIEYKDLWPTVSSSGRHILFYKQDGDDYWMKVVSVKELVEGL